MIVGDACEDVGEIGLWVDAIQLTRLDQRGKDTLSSVATLYLLWCGEKFGDPGAEEAGFLVWVRPMIL